MEAVDPNNSRWLVTSEGSDHLPGPQRRVRSCFPPQPWRGLPFHQEERVRQVGVNPSPLPPGRPSCLLLGEATGRNRRDSFTYWAQVELTQSWRAAVQVEQERPCPTPGPVRH